MKVTLLCVCVCVRMCMHVCVVFVACVGACVLCMSASVYVQLMSVMSIHPYTFIPSSNMSLSKVI